MSKTFFNGKTVFGDGISLCRFCGPKLLINGKPALQISINSKPAVEWDYSRLTYSEVEQLSKQLERFLNDAVDDDCEEMKFDHEV